jgi:hypothetical protein
MYNWFVSEEASEDDAGKDGAHCCEEGSISVQMGCEMELAWLGL